MRPKVISLYSGAGGLDYGLEAAGFMHGVALEIDADCCATLRASRPGWAVVEDDICRVPTRALLDRAGVGPCGDTALIGGPPCQPFSKSGYWSSGDSLRLRDPRAVTLREYLRVLAGTLPRAFVMENVEGLAYRGKDEGLRLFLRRVAAINRKTGTRYRPVTVTVNAADHGVPQHRTRVLVIGLRDGGTFRLPPPTHGDGLLVEPWRTAWDAIGDLDGADDGPAMRGKWAELLASIPEGANYLHHTERGDGLPLFGWRRRYWNFLLKLAKDKPSWTLQAQPGPATGPFHWRNRRLTVREMARLQTFPDDVRFAGAYGSQVRQIGNAVPGLLAEVIGRAVLEQAFGVTSAGPLALLPPPRRPVPPPEPEQRVPAGYLRMLGRHEAHPGTGKGYRAARRVPVAGP